MASDFFNNLPKAEQDKLKDIVKLTLNYQESDKANKEAKEISDWAKSKTEEENQFKILNTQKNEKK